MTPKNIFEKYLGVMMHGRVGQLHVKISQKYFRTKHETIQEVIKKNKKNKTDMYQKSKRFPGHRYKYMHHVVSAPKTT